MLVAGSFEEADDLAAHHSPGPAAARGGGIILAQEPPLSLAQVRSTAQHDRSGASSAATTTVPAALPESVDDSMYRADYGDGDDVDDQFNVEDDNAVESDSDLSFDAHAPPSPAASLSETPPTQSPDSSPIGKPRKATISVKRKRGTLTPPSTSASPKARRSRERSPSNGSSNPRAGKAATLSSTQ